MSHNINRTDVKADLQYERRVAVSFDPLPLSNIIAPLFCDQFVLSRSLYLVISCI